MPLSWNEIRLRSIQFAHEWKDERSEHAEAKSFWDDFFNIFGVSRRRIATFETKSKKVDGKTGFIDLLWKGVLLVEHKSQGKSLDRAHAQAIDYFPGIKDRDLPRYIVVCDFQKFRLYDLEKGVNSEFTIVDLHKNIQKFGFIAGYQTPTFKEQDPVNIEAAELMGKLHDQLKNIGYSGHDLEVYLVRILFCLFAEDTGIFERQQFDLYIQDRTSEDGSDLAMHLATLFHVLNTPSDKRLKNRDLQLADFPYVNGDLFSELLPPAGFDSDMRNLLLECSALDWSQISPAIFGSLFQSIMDKKARRDIGAHYTSEKNILKVVNPLFMDQLKSEFESVKRNRKKLFIFQQKLKKLKIFDPACGCGNFLVIAYRELRLLEHEVIKILFKNLGQSGQREGTETLVQLDVDQFYGLEIAEFPAQIAQVALWLMDHQMNLKLSEEIGIYFVRIPLYTSANIITANALSLDWGNLIPPNEIDYIFGNPPFLGKKEQSASQKQELRSVFREVKKSGCLDYVSCWYMKACEYAAHNKNIEIAFVSTNSITQGEQVGVLWPALLAKGIFINFAHRTFQWTSEARGKAAVHCVVIGFSYEERSKKQIYEYDDVKGEPLLIAGKNINPYLVDAKNITLKTRRKPIQDVPRLSFGSMPNDGGHLLLTDEEMLDYVSEEPTGEKYLRPFLGSDEFINARPRWCFWLVDVPSREIRANKILKQKISDVRVKRLQSTRPETISLADTPALFGEIRQPASRYIAIPKTSSELRNYIPIDYLEPGVIASTELFTVDDGDLYTLGVLMSHMHMAWTRGVCGRLESRYRYSAGIVYNNYPWPVNVNEAKMNVVKNCVSHVLKVRKKHQGQSFADLYDPIATPKTLVDAHRKLDVEVDKLYRRKKFLTESERVAFLLELNEAIISDA